MALPATETFTGTDGTSPPNANWTNRMNTIVIQTNGFRGGSSGGNAAYWNADAFDAAHYSQAKLVATSTGANARGPAIRIQSGANSFFYCLRDNDGNTYNGESVAGSLTDWDAGIAAGALSVVHQIAVDQTTATTIYYKKDGVTAATYTGKNALSGGAAGVCSFNAATTDYGDDWEGGDVGGGVSYTETGFATLGMVTGGADQSAWINAGAAVWGKVSAGADQATWIDTGLSVWGKVSAGGDVATWIDAGVSVWSEASSGADLAGWVDAGMAVWNEVGTGADQAAWSDTALAVWGMVASGVDQTALIDAALAIWGEIVSGTETYTPAGAASYVETGFAEWGLESSGLDVLAGIDAGATIWDQVSAGDDGLGVAVTGSAVWGQVSTSADSLTGIDAGAAIVGEVSTGAEVGIGIDSAAVLFGWIVDGADLETMTDTGVTIWGMVASGDYPGLLQTFVPANRGEAVSDHARVTAQNDGAVW